jgi:hypothetical protein
MVGLIKSAYKDPAALDFLTALWTEMKSTETELAATIPSILEEKDQEVADTLVWIATGSNLATLQKEWPVQKGKLQLKIDEELKDRRKRKMKTAGHPLALYIAHVDLASTGLSPLHGALLAGIQEPQKYYKKSRARLQLWWQVLLFDFSRMQTAPIITDADNCADTKRYQEEDLESRPHKLPRLEPGQKVDGELGISNVQDNLAANSSKYESSVHERPSGSTRVLYTELTKTDSTLLHWANDLHLSNYRFATISWTTDDVVGQLCRFGPSAHIPRVYRDPYLNIYDVSHLSSQMVVGMQIECWYKKWHDEATSLHKVLSVDRISVFMPRGDIKKPSTVHFVFLIS